MLAQKRKKLSYARHKKAFVHGKDAALQAHTFTAPFISLTGPISKAHLYVLYLFRILPHVFPAVNENSSDIEGSKQLLHIVPALLHRAYDDLHLLRIAHDILQEAPPLLAIR